MRGTPERAIPSRIGAPSSTSRTNTARWPFDTCPRRGRAPVRKVSLEHVTLDLSALPAAGVSDKVVLLGENGGESISFTHSAEWQGARPHHVLTAFDQHLPNHYVDEEQEPSA